MRRLLLFLAVVFIISCSTIDCPVQNKVALNFAVKKYNSSGVEVTDTLRDTLYVWTERKNGTDTLILNRAVDGRCNGVRR